jgi:hypothetical protein
VKRPIALLIVLIAASLCETVSAYDARNTKDNQELAARAGLMVGRYEVCKLDTSRVVAALNSKYEWLSKVYPENSAGELKALFLAGQKMAIAKFKPSAETPCKTQAEVDEGTTIFQAAVEGMERVYKADRKFAAATWLEEQERNSPDFEFLETQFPSLLRQNPQAQAAFLGAVAKNLVNPKYNDAVRSHTQRLAGIGLYGPDLQIAASFAAIRSAGDWDSINAVMWPLSGKGSYEEALKRAYEATDPERKKTKR